ncbi:hypothetical protein [Pandoraea pulmonicola]|uniref:Uncharacterized protein n=1 Tax=Pandoraea pulmonicola TaxID=93221 RepID=A0AAJ4ZFF6_PANPU|nr:hypothetical protein [Pandoraea pulmonicola]AJC19556.1 hypothetical protein RO07_01955 [Pandoraea pulmonicola]SUA92367.1 Uncharacterised protein [Pandoraea pulmonicola]
MKTKTTDSNTGTYENPKAWGDSAQTGDIFIVGASDKSQDNTVGDYFIAQFDGPSSSHPFPGYGKNDSYWQHAWSTTLIELITESGLEEGAIYANGLNQIGILVFITAEDANGNAVPLSQDVLDRVQPTLQLIDYTSGDALPQGWSFTDQENEFHHLPHAMETASQSSDLGDSEEKSRFKLYLSCSPTPAVTPLTIGAQLTMASGKTAASSRTDPTDHSSVAIETLPPKRYNLTNITVDSNKLGDITLSTENGRITATYRQYASYLKITDAGFYIEKYTVTKGKMASAPWVDQFGLFPMASFYASYIWDPDAAVVFCRAVIGYANNDSNSPIWGQGVLSDGGEKNGVGIYYLLLPEITLGAVNFPPTIFEDTQVSIYDQYGNSDLFTVVFNGGNGLLSVKAGANPSWDPSGTGTFPTIVN